MHGGLKLARPRHHRRWPLVVAGLALLVGLWPRLAAAIPAVAEGMNRMLGDRLLSGYTERLAALEQQNASLHEQVARAEEALAENEALRSLLDSGRVQGSWQPARVVARYPDGVTLACTAEDGAAVLDVQGRYAGRVVQCSQNDTCRVAWAGTEEDPCAGLSGPFAGLLERQSGWTLTGLPADCGLTAGTVVTTPGGYWLGVLGEAPQADRDGLTARALLQDTADLSSTVFFVKN